MYLRDENTQKGRWCVSFVDRKSKIILKTIKASFKLESFFSFPPPPLIFHSNIIFAKICTLEKKASSTRTTRNEKKRCKKIADASRRGEKDRELETADDRILLVMPPPFVCFWKMFGPVPRSPSGRSPSLCRWWRSAGVAGSAGAPTPRGSCRGVHRRKREPVRGLLAAPTCTHPPLAGCSVEACNLSLGIRGGKTEELALPSRRTIRCAERKNREKNLVTLKKIVASMHTAQLLSIRSIRSSSENATFYSMYANRAEFHFLAHFQLWQRSMFFQTAWPSF